MSDVVATRLLADVPEVIPTLAGWYKSEWITWFNDTPLEEIEAAEHAARLQIPKLYAATHSAVSTFEHAGWLGFDQVLHEGQTLTIFAKRVG